MTLSRSLPNGSLLDSYKIINIIGAGGFGVTYKALDRQSAVLVAIKEYFPSRLARRIGGSDVVPSSQETVADFRWGLERFENEGQSLALFRHPNITPVLRLFRANNTAYMVLRLEAGQNLKQWKSSLKRPPGQADLDRLLEPLLDALSIVHSNGMLHRDIAPDNIIMRDDGYPILLDFGAARNAVETRGAGQSTIVKGGFSPPEQYFTDPKLNRQGPWTDIYSMAATLYYLITGKTPPQGSQRLAQDTYVPIVASVPGGYRYDFLMAIDEAMKTQPAQRPRSIRIWREQLFTGRKTNQQPGVIPQIKPRITKVLAAARNKFPLRPMQSFQPRREEGRAHMAEPRKLPQGMRLAGSLQQLARHPAISAIIAAAVVFAGIALAISFASQMLN